MPTKMRWTGRLCLAFAAAMTMAWPAAAQGVGFGVKGGLSFAEFTTDDFHLDNRTGWQAGLFVGGNRDGVVGFQGEFNWVRKETTFFDSGVEIGTVKLDYLQVPMLLRINAGTKSKNGFALYGLAGPSFEVKLRDEITGFGGGSTSDYSFENIDVGLMFGGGVEISRFIIEGRYSKGLRSVNKNFKDVTELKVNSFAALVGIRFN